MALDPVVNFFQSEIATLPVSDAGVTIVVSSGDGAKLPNPAVDGAFNLTIYKDGDPFASPEIVRVTARSTDTLTVTRAQEGSIATTKTAGSTWKVVMFPTAKTIQDIDSLKVNVADIVNNLTSTDTNKPLSANQGKVLQDGKVAKSGDTMTGNLTIDSTGHIKIPSGTTAQRPGTPVAGMMRFNTNNDSLEVYNGTFWDLVKGGLIATGGTITDITDAGFSYRVHTFTGSSNFEVTTGSGVVEYLIVAGGGGGGAGAGSYYGGGGGAGGYISSTELILNPSVYPVVVGAGGVYINSSDIAGTSGGNSSALGITAIGGGGGAGSTAALSGGSGGGASFLSNTGGAGTSGQGFKGGDYNTGGQGAPGGSSSGAGPNNSTVALAGTSNSINGSSVAYARGGDGVFTGTGGVGSNNGNGGKGGRPTGGEVGNNGVSGVVIIRYRIA
jgi:hypothetical protein